MEAHVEISEKKRQTSFVGGVGDCIAEVAWLGVQWFGHALATLLLFAFYFAQVALGAVARQAKVMYRSVDRHIAGAQYVPRRANS